jgi:hypothetical protein
MTSSDLEGARQLTDDGGVVTRVTLVGVEQLAVCHEQKFLPRELLCQCHHLRCGRHPATCHVQVTPHLVQITHLAQQVCNIIYNYISIMATNSREDLITWP